MVMDREAWHAAVHRGGKELDMTVIELKEKQLLVYSKMVMDLKWDQSLLSTAGGKDHQPRHLAF